MKFYLVILIFWLVFFFFLVIGKEGVWVCYRKGRWKYWMVKRGGLVGKEWEIVKDDFFVGEMKG